MGERRIMFGVGATKSGTSWLHRFLMSHPACQFRSIKELHYFNTVESGSFDGRISFIRAALEKATGAERKDLLQWLSVLEARREDMPGYLGYLEDGAGDDQLVGEITPAYALLPESRLKQMANLLGDVRFVYLVRDPVARLWSHVRMESRRLEKRRGANPARQDRILRKALRGNVPQITSRGDYRGAIERLSNAIDPSRLLILVFEELVTGKVVDRLCRFLGIQTVQADLSPVHVGRPALMSSERAVAARDMLNPQYEYMAQYLGREPQDWLYDRTQVGS